MKEELILKRTFLFVFFLIVSSFAFSQNMDNYITLEVEPGTPSVDLEFKAIADNTTIKVVSADENEINIDSDWSGLLNFDINDVTNKVTIYGDLDGFECKENSIVSLDISNNPLLEEFNCYDNLITTLDVSNNPELLYLDCGENSITNLDISNNTKLWEFSCDNNNLNTLDVSNHPQLYYIVCFGNNFNTSVIDNLYCNLPDRSSDGYPGSIVVADMPSDDNIDIVLASNAQNAIDKNWNVLYYETETQVETIGNYNCDNNGDDVNMDNYITLELVPNTTNISLDLKATADDTPIKIIGKTETLLTVGTNWSGEFNIQVNVSTNKVTIYGDINGLDCNDDNVKVVDASNNSLLEELYCYDNQITTIDLSNNPLLDILRIDSNQLTSIDLSNNESLGYLDCSYNQISTIDLSNNLLLEVLYCSYNKLTSLDLSNNLQLDLVYCFENYFTTLAVDEIYCLLPEKSAEDYGILYIAYDDTDTNIDNILTSNAQNAIDKNWQVLYSSNYAQVITTGNYDCDSNDEICNTVSNLSYTLLNDVVTLTWNYSEEDVTFNVYKDGSLVSTTSDQTYTEEGLEIGTYNYCVEVLCSDTLTSDQVCKDVEVVEEIVNMDNYITLELVPNTTHISLDLKATADDTPIKIIGKTETLLTVGKNWSGEVDIQVNVSTNSVTIYGDIDGLDCNDDNVKVVDASNNSLLEELYCYDNQITTIDLSNNPLLDILRIDSNQLTSIDLSNNESLGYLDCSHNQITNLDLSNNLELEVFYCSYNQLTTLDISNNLKLYVVYCFENNFTTLSIDELYCLLPEKSAEDYGILYIAYDGTDTNIDNVLASNAQNAIDKSWQVLYNSDYSQVITTGDYDCDSNDEICNTVSNLSYIISNDVVTLTWDYSEDYVSFNVYKDGLLVGNTSDQTYTEEGLELGTYNYCVEVVCSDTLTSDQICVDVDITTGIEDYNNLSIYPNPADNVIYIDYENLERVLIYNNIGKLVNGYFDNTIDVSSYNPGIYFIEIQDKEGKTLNSKILIK